MYGCVFHLNAERNAGILSTTMWSVVLMRFSQHIYSNTGYFLIIVWPTHSCWWQTGDSWLHEEVYTSAKDSFCSNIWVVLKPKRLEITFYSYNHIHVKFVTDICVSGDVQSFHLLCRLSAHCLPQLSKTKVLLKQVDESVKLTSDRRQWYRGELLRILLSSC